MTAVQKRLQQANLAVAKDIAHSPQSAEKLWRGSVDLIERLGEIHESAMGVLRQVEAVGRGDLPATVLEPLLAGKTSPAELYNKLLSEVRKQLQTGLQLAERIANVKEVQQVQDVLFDELGRCDPELRDRVFLRLAKASGIHHLALPKQ